MALNASPNVAVLNGGDRCGECGNGGVHQSSGASSRAFAGNWNSSDQSNELDQGAEQSQQGGSGSCCGGAERSQSIDQSQNASNSIEQNATARSVAVNASPNVAVLNSGPVDQSSSATSGAFAVNENQASQSNTLDQRADQEQQGGDCNRCNPCNPCNPCDQCEPERGCED